MRQSDVAPHLHQHLVPVDGKPNVRAMVAPPTPRALPAGSGSPALAHAASQALGRLIGAMEGWINPDILTRTLVRREAVQSSQIEGTKTDLDELLTYEATWSADGLPPDVRTTQHYVEALQYGLDAVRSGGRAALDCTLVRQIHAMLMEHENVPKGTYRDIQAWIGTGRIEDASFVPAPPADIDACMRDLEQNMLRYARREDEQGELTVLAQMAIAHAQFETIHPFNDGNGRTGRILMPLILAAEGLPPLYLSGMLMRNRSGYYSALKQVQLQGKWGPWIDMTYRAVLEAAGECVSLADDLRAIGRAWSEATSGYRSHSVVRRLPELLIEQPVVTANTVAALLDVSLVAASKGINELMTIGILKAKDQRTWGRSFHASEIIDRLNKAPATPR